jgi:hypothetical protein
VRDSTKETRDAGDEVSRNLLRGCVRRRSEPRRPPHSATEPHPDAEGAEAYERELIEAVLSTSKPWREERRLADFAVEFLESYCAANNRYASIEAKESILRVHLIPSMGELLLSEINARRIEAYKAQKLVEELSPKTVNNHLTVVRKLDGCSRGGAWRISPAMSASTRDVAAPPRSL